MQATDRNFREIINNSLQFIVPVFQRDYKWGSRQWQRLWDDVNRAASLNPATGHFLGSLVQIDTGRTTPSLSSWLVIDGQQRLATLTLMMTALRDHINETGWDGDDTGPTPELLDDLFLKNRHARGDARYKLSLRRTDDSTLHALVDGKGLDTLESRPSGQIAGGYQFFRERMRDCNPSAIYNGIASLRIVEVTLNREHDDPQFIFESLNDTGIDLSPGDMVRNYLLMRLEEQEQTGLYLEYWSKIENHFRNDQGQMNDAEFNSFLQNYLALKTKVRRQIPDNSLYEAFKRYKETQAESGLEHLLADLRRFAGYYAAFQGRMPGHPPGLVDAMRQVRRRGTTPAALVMQLWDCYDRQDTLAERDFIQALTLIESYLLRRAVMGVQTRWGSYWSTFAGFAHNIGDKPPLEHLRQDFAGIESWKWNWRFPTDREFAKALEERDLYSLDVTCKRILERLENFETKEPSVTDNLSIEHIMPQSPGPEWQEMLGENWQQVHSQWLHRMGNLTLTGYNPEMSNRPFDDKKTIPGGFSDSAVHLNRFVREQQVWTAAEMEARGKDLAQRALRIWPHPR